MVRTHTFTTNDDGSIFHYPRALKTGTVMPGEKTVLTAFEVRRLEAADYLRLAEIYHSNDPEVNVTADEIRFDDETWDYKKYVLKQFVATISGRVEGWAIYWQEPDMYHPQKFSMNIAVDPLKQSLGLGSVLYAQILAELQRLYAILVRCEIKENMIAGKAFLQHRGFVEIHRKWESHLQVAEFSAEPFKHYEERTASQQVKITTLLEEAKLDPDCYRKLHELWFQKLGYDMPWPDTYTPISFEDFMTRVVKGPGILPDGCFIAKVEGRYVGLSWSQKSEKEPNVLWQMITGVLGEYRGRGIAVALKLRVIDFARRNGYDVVKTVNSSANKAMLGVNRKLGFRRHVGRITFQKPLNF